ncbi:unnamed protein product [Microthlaspi erraticum]|uniref:Uncharacterized protein n=1 Tax=Microthlaspi erraticum TaxID=1685480 RepID=A0A6D2IWJ8_9BRAS|nr:unnamed protein product [Microthlaspi erraticum]
MVCIDLEDGVLLRAREKETVESWSCDSKEVKEHVITNIGIFVRCYFSIGGRSQIRLDFGFVQNPVCAKIVQIQIRASFGSNPVCVKVEAKSKEDEDNSAKSPCDENPTEDSRTNLSWPARPDAA